MMRIFIVATIIHFSPLMNAGAQLLMGPVAGGSLSKVFLFDHSNDFDTSPTLGFDAGLMASMRVRTNFVLNMQLLYSQRSKSISGLDLKGHDPQFRISSTMQYIEMPIFYVLEFKNFTKGLKGAGGKRKSYNWFVGAGPVISYWLSNSGTLKSSNLLENGISKIDYTTVFGQENTSFDLLVDMNKQSITDPNRFQFAVNISGGLAFEPIGLHKIVTTMHLYIGQTFFSSKTDGYFPISPYDVDAMKAKNHSIRFSIAYLFDTKIENLKKGKSTNSVKNRKR